MESDGEKKRFVEDGVAVRTEALPIGAANYNHYLSPFSFISLTAMGMVWQAKSQYGAGDAARSLDWHSTHCFTSCARVGCGFNHLQQRHNRDRNSDVSSRYCAVPTASF